MEALEGRGELVHGHQHVLDNLVFLVHLLDGLALRQLQQRDLRGNHPAEQVAEQRVVTKRDDVLGDRKNWCVI